MTLNDAQGSAAVPYWANEIPLTSAKPPGSRYEKDRLIHATNLDSERAFLQAHHIGRDHCASGFLARIAIDPRDKERS
jgi:hypothetical protein